MARDFQINGEAMVQVKGGAHTSLLGPDYRIDTAQELGLSSEQIRISPIIHHHDLRTDSFGPNVPAEVLWMNAEVRISMTLVHFDRKILDTCLAESMGGLPAANLVAGELAPPGMPLGGYKQLYASGCHFMSLGITSPLQDLPYRFIACYLAQNPVEIPLGSERSLVQCNWRAIPYVVPSENEVGGGTPLPPRFKELICSGATLWDHTPLNIGE